MALEGRGFGIGSGVGGVSNHVRARDLRMQIIRVPLGARYVKY
jgi:hypothetical protein